jgi:anti-anti-sigma factor
VPDDPLPVRWSGRQAIVTLPEQIDASNAGQVREELLAVINQGATELVADMTATLSCDYGGADALVRAYQRAAVSGTQLRLVVTAPVVRRILEVNGLDRLISIYPDLESATTAGSPAVVLPLLSRPDRAARRSQARSRGAGPTPRPQETADQGWPGAAALTPAVLWNLVDALSDGVLLADDSGVIVLANRRLGEMFGYQHGELAGRQVESLIPVGLRAAHAEHRAGYARERTARPMASRTRLVGLRQDGATLPVEISLSPVRTRTGYFTLAVVRDTTEVQQRQDLAELARAVAAGEGEQEQKTTELLDRVVNSLLHVGLSLETAIDLPHDLARQRITDALQRLDNTIHEIRDHVFAARARRSQPDPATPGGPE